MGQISDMQSLSKSERIIECKRRCFGLWGKYVRVGCAFEINISYIERNKMYNLIIDNNDINDDCQTLCIVFDGCILEMFRLMNDSFNRFKRSATFKNLELMPL